MSSSSSWSSSEDSQTATNSGMTSTNVLRWLALGLECLGGTLIIIIAVYLRLAHLHPDITGLNWKLLCEDISLYAIQNDDVNSVLYYPLVLFIPTVFILIGEVEYSLFSRNSKIDFMSKSERMRKNLPRMGRIFAMFILGIMLVSFINDYLQILITQPRPNFLTLYSGNCPSAFNGTLTEDFYDALKSFPCHLASVAGFCCMFAVSHAHKVYRYAFCRAPVLIPILSQGLVILAVTTSFTYYTCNVNHLSDVVGGLLIGVVVGVYMSFLVSFLIKSKETAEATNWANYQDSIIPRVSVVPRNPNISRTMTSSLQQSHNV